MDIAYRDSGVYACHAGLSKAEIKLTVKPKPGDPAPTDEDYKEDTGSYMLAFLIMHIYLKIISINNKVLIL